ncbi:hypothetical protein P153DRAFT_304376 [Dothidotthia symphoricarpi CBS 119687]|uniref:BZIP domain-containing protein n=1 Tax=Dothidotthia symphoricarpi CBS 119687 TaxID=1392245 RepID=A0A6A5ZY49_9PLEO|nr:uncharacterized protein P153DRAFT_304376 [Dothidotthia symphoricarpi CBS 119687]KAF2123298.1 hypothetical protein P153DRAFT_304376 [Dothidotthia symphoricarpi CBS 119687]
MGALLTLPITLLNLLLPFTKPGTPILQDLIHTTVLCGTLYYAPQIAEWYNTRQAPPTNEGPQDARGIEEINHDEPPLDEHPDADMVENGAGDAGGGIDAHERRPPAPHVEDFAEPLPNQLFNGNNNDNDDENDDDALPGPADQRPRPTPANRPIGAKKAKSLARKDQRRAYHEFHRQEAELRRLQDAEGAMERDLALSAEKTRRARIEAEIAERERTERERRKEDERREVEEESARRERVVRLVRERVGEGGCVDLVDVAWGEGKDRVWVERLVRASGLLGQLSRDGGHALITGEGWLVRLDGEVMRRAYADAEAFGKGNEGRVGLAEFGGVLERAILARAGA